MKKNLLCRSSLSISADLLAQFDAMCKTRGYQSRSQAVADMVRGQLIEHRAQSG